MSEYPQYQIVPSDGFSQGRPFYPENREEVEPAALRMLQEIQEITHLYAYRIDEDGVAVIGQGGASAGRVWFQWIEKTTLAR